MNMNVLNGHLLSPCRALQLRHRLQLPDKQPCQARRAGYVRIHSSNGLVRQLAASEELDRRGVNSDHLNSEHGFHDIAGGHLPYRLQRENRRSRLASAFRLKSLDLAPYHKGDFV